MFRRIIAPHNGKRCFSTFFKSSLERQVVIVSAKRTPTGSFGGSLSSQTAIQLGTNAVKASIDSAGINPSLVDAVILGNVCQANIGQSPARQVQLASGLDESIDATTINKVCASGLKSVIYGTQSIQLGQSHTVIGGGFESMSNIPYYVPNIRFKGLKFGDAKLVDGLVRDGLSDAYDGTAMGCASDYIAQRYEISRKQQDDYAICSYQRAQDALKCGYFKNEMIPIDLSLKNGHSTSSDNAITTQIIDQDEEIHKVVIERVRTLKPAFGKDGTATAANSSKINDGASALVLMSEDKALELGLKPLARILGYSDGACKPIDFPISPSLSLPRAIAMARLTNDDIDMWEINEAFSSVALVNMKLLNISQDKLNIRGGAVALGHAIGSSGSRILVTLTHTLIQTGKRYGAVAICNGGGGSSAIVIERL